MTVFDETVQAITVQAERNSSALHTW